MKELGIQFKILKHLQDQNVEKIKDYLLHLVCEYPNPTDCPIDQSILSNMKKLLISKGWTISTSPIRGIILISSQGEEYSSHKNGTAKYHF